MPSFISKFLFTITVTAPTFMSLGLIEVIKDNDIYFQQWNDLLKNGIITTSFEWGEHKCQLDVYANMPFW